jgi:3-dehydroquinate synthase
MTPQPTAPRLSRKPVRLDVPSAAGSYPVIIGSDTSLTIPAALDDAGLPARRIVVSSPTVWRCHGERLRAASAEEPILIPDGERFKHLGTVGRIYDALIRAAADRATTVIAAGGGVLGDIAGFAAATYLRGIPVVHVPTTLLAQVDSAIGGKVGVNHPLGKNLIGAFNSPRAVIIDPHLLGTLPRREFRAGLYEVVKYGVIASRSLFEALPGSLKALFARDEQALLPVIAECCRIKASVVARDEHEIGPRRALNFGHTAGHALEAVTKYRRFRHGEAVAYGMRVAAEVGVRRGLLPPGDRDALSTLITQMGPLPPIGDLAVSDIIGTMRHDKKVVAGRLHFVLPAGIGGTVVVDDVTEAELTQALVSFGMPTR